jgi:glycosyltransferase
MRVLFAAAAARPHLFPLVPLAWAFRSAGHEVCVAGTEGIATDLVDTGLPAVVVHSEPNQVSAARKPLLDTIYQQAPWPDEWAVNQDQLTPAQRKYLRMLGTVLLLGAHSMVNDLLAFARQWRPDLIVHDAITYAGPVVAQVLGIPNVRHLFGTASLPRLELDRGKPLPEYTRMFDRFHTEVRVDATATVDPTPPRMRLSAPDPPSFDMRYIAYNGPGVLPFRLRTEARRQRVCVTWGHTSARALGEAAADPYRIAIQALAQLDVEIIVVTTAAQLKSLGRLPRSAWSAPSVPLHLVLPHCDLLVHQGGDGTTLTAAALGVPQLAITRKPDAELVGARLASVGIGKHLRYQELRNSPRQLEVIRTTVLGLLGGTSCRAAAKWLRAEIERQPAPAEIEPELTALAC